MNKSMKLYTKAINCYNEGYIEKSLEYCEKSISENLKNTSAINLKGLLYYLKGDLENAQALWKMNSQVNKDLVSKKYLEDSISDEEKKRYYQAALNCMKELKIKEALQLLEQCKDSDFNSINVSNSIAICYIKLGEYEKALANIDSVLNIDKNNKLALQNKKELISFGVISREFNFQYLSITVAALILVSGLILGFKEVNKLYLLNKANKSEVLMDSKLEPNPIDETRNEKNNEEIEVKPISEVFPKEDISKNLESKDYEKLYEVYIKWSNKVLNINDKALLDKVKEVLSGDGAEYFYSKGRKYLSEKDYKNSISYLTKIYTVGQENYLYSHTIYLLAVSYKNIGDLESSIKYYKQYDEKFPNGDYEDAVLYDLALIYKNIDSNEAKNYAKKLTKSYPKSIYINSIIKSLLS